MEKEFLPYDRALKLKQLGFKERCLTYYENGIAMINSVLTVDGWDYNTSFLTYASRPTFQQAFRFFREKYDLHYLRPTKYSETKWWGIGGNTKVCDSYEEAELACLDKLIEIVEGRES
jgi:hypothetical protein